jgi:hypothetical protein
VGFKYIADVLLSLETSGRFGDVQAQPGDLVLAAEESHGFLLTPEIRDKDAAGAALVLCDLLGQLRSQGRFLTDYLDALSIESGNYVNMARSIVMRGIQGAGLIASMMASLRADPPSRLGDFAVTGFEDYCSPKFGTFSAQDQTERQARNLLLLELDGAQVVIRPSGTEPKAKIYVDAEGRRLVPGAGRAAAAAVAQQIAGLVYALCLERIGFRLRPSAALLPDYIDLDLKSDFDTRFRAELKKKAENWGACTPASQLDWLRQELALYVPGADPIASVQYAVASLADELATETDDPSPLQALRQLKETLAACRLGMGPAS